MIVMKTVKNCLAGGCLLLAALTLPAQNYYLATQQAKRASAQNDAEQQRIQNASGGAPGTPAAAAHASAPAAPMDPALQATLKNIAGLQADFAAIMSAADKSDPAQKISLLNNLTQAAQGTKASADSVKRVADDLLTAVSGKPKLVLAQQTKLAREVHALFNSAHLTSTQQTALLTDVQKILTDAVTPLGDAVNLTTDLKAVVAETK